MTIHLWQVGRGRIVIRLYNSMNETKFGIMKQFAYATPKENYEVEYFVWHYKVNG